MTEPNLDEFINQCKDKCYLTNGRNASNDLEGDFGTWEDWKLAIGEFVANQVREARIDERSQAQQYLHGLTITPESQHLFDVLSRDNHNRIATLKGVKNK